MVKNIDDVSIIICCYNSATRISDTLSHLAKQKITPGIRLEIILVNNCSTDNTAEKASECWDYWGRPFSLEVVDEYRSGLSFARERGIEVSRGELIIFCDDDNWLAFDYVDKACNLAKEHEEVGVFGGLGSAHIDVEMPTWFDRFNSDYATGAQSRESGDVTDNRGYVFGAGMVIRKAYFLAAKELAIDSFLTGRKSNQLLAGDDTEICFRMREAGFSIYYSSLLRFQHYIPEYRLEWPYLVRMNHGFAKGSSFLNCYNYVRRTNYVKGGWRLLFEMCKDYLTFLVKRRKHILTFNSVFKEEGNRDRLVTYYYWIMLWNIFFNVKSHVRLIDQIRRSYLKKG